MKNFKSLVLGLSLLLCFSTVRADEGMWLLSLLKKNAAEMQEKGFKLSAEDIYKINESCLKDAIVGLGSEGRPFATFVQEKLFRIKDYF